MASVTLGARRYRACACVPREFAKSVVHVVLSSGPFLKMLGRAFRRLGQTPLENGQGRCKHFCNVVECSNASNAGSTEATLIPLQGAIFERVVGVLRVSSWIMPAMSNHPQVYASGTSRVS